MAADSGCTGPPSARATCTRSPASMTATRCETSSGGESAALESRQAADTMAAARCRGGKVAPAPMATARTLAGPPPASSTSFTSLRSSCGRHADAIAGRTATTRDLA